MTLLYLNCKLLETCIPVFFLCACTAWSPVGFQPGHYNVCMLTQILKISIFIWKTLFKYLLWVVDEVSYFKRTSAVTLLKTGLWCLIFTHDLSIEKSWIKKEITKPGWFSCHRCVEKGMSKLTWFSFLFPSWPAHLLSHLFPVIYTSSSCSLQIPAVLVTSRRGYTCSCGWCGSWPSACRSHLSASSAPCSPAWGAGPQNICLLGLSVVTCQGKQLYLI